LDIKMAASEQKV